MKTELMNLFIFLAICFVGYLLFRNLDFKEGFGSSSAPSSQTSTKTPTSSSSSSSTPSNTSVTNGIAGNSATYAANIKAQTIKLSDTLLVSKYRSDYENVVLNMDDLVNNLMLQATLSVDQSSPSESLEAISKLNQCKTALNNVMKFIDSAA